MEEEPGGHALSVLEMTIPSLRHQMMLFRVVFNCLQSLEKNCMETVFRSCIAMRAVLWEASAAGNPWNARSPSTEHVFAPWSKCQAQGGVLVDF